MSNENKNLVNEGQPSAVPGSELRPASMLNAGRELDALIAERVMGWRWFKCVSTAVLVSPHCAADWLQRPVLYEPLNSPGNLKREHLDGVFFYDSREGKTKPEFPSYSTDIAAVMEVAGKMIAEGAHPAMNYFGDNAAGTHWNVTIFRAGGDDGRSISATGATLPEAICRAALAAIEATNQVREAATT